METRVPFPTYPASVVPQMPMAESVFDRCFKKFGGRLTAVPGSGEILSPEWFKRRFWDYLKKLQESELYGPALSNAHFDYIDNPALNAVVGPSDDLVLIGLFSGAVDNLAIFFNMLLSHPEVFIAVGDPAEETKWFEDLRLWDWRLSWWQSLRSLQDTEPPLPKGQRRHFAGHLLMFALDFLFFHEVGHWCNGHDRLARSFQSQRSQFINEQTPFQLPPILNQFLELNADSFAVIFMTNEWFQMPLGPTSIFHSALEALRVWVTAIAFIFFLFGQERKIRVVRPMGVHPHPALFDLYPHPSIRLQNAHQTAMGIASMFSSEAASTIARAWDEGLAAAIQACERLRIPSSVWFTDPETATRTYQALCMNFVVYRSELNASTRLNKATTEAKNRTLPEVQSG